MYTNRLTVTYNYKNVSIRLLFLFSLQCVMSQSSIYGKIIDTNNEPIPFAHIRLENTNIGTISNSNGEFKLAVIVKAENKRLIISSLGYKTKQSKTE